MEQKISSKLDELINDVEDYIKSRQELSKLIAVQKSSIVAAGIFSSLVIFILFFFVFVFASIALAHLISAYTGKTYWGYLSVALLYLFTGILAYIKRKTWLENPLMNAIVKNFFDNEDHD